MHTCWITLSLCCLLTSPSVQQRLEPTRVHVTVVDEQGKPVPGAKVCTTCRVMRRINDKLMGENFCLGQERAADSQGTLIIEMAKSELGSALRLRASHQGAFTEKPMELKDPAGEPSIKLQISRQHARAVQVRVVDEKGKPIRGASVAVHHIPTWPGGSSSGPSRPVLPEDKSTWVTDAEGRFTTPRILDPDGTYLLRLQAEGFLKEDTPWKPVAKDTTLDFGDRTLQRLQQIAGQVKDRQGQPVAGARVLWLDTKQRVQGTTDATGQFRLHAALAPPGFLFVEKEGFRFHGQPYQKEEQTLITLVRREEPSGKTMTTLPILPRAQRKELVAKLIEPCVAKVGEMEEIHRYPTYQALAKLDASRLNALLEKHPITHERVKFGMHQLAGHALGQENLEAAQAYIATVKDPLTRSNTLVNLFDDLAVGQRERKLALLHQAWQEGKQASKPEQLVAIRAMIARRLWAMGEHAEATQLLRDGHATAKELPAGDWPNMARGSFAQSLGLIDLPAALELLQSLQGGDDHERFHCKLARTVAAVDPAGAERIVEMLQIPPQNRTGLVMQLCYTMAPVDLPRARKLVEKYVARDRLMHIRALGYLAQALVRTKPREALALVEEAFTLLATWRVTTGDAAVNGIFLLPVVEQINPALVPEFYWRALSFSTPFQGNDNTLYHGGYSYMGSLGLVVARYDHDMAMTLICLDTPVRGYMAGLPNHLYAAALADPARAVALVEEMPPGEKQDKARLGIANFLLTEGEGRWRAVHRALWYWHVDEENY